MSEDPDLLLDKRRVRQSFNRAAETYDDAAVLQKEVGQRLLERLLLVRDRPRHILDLGAGTGLVTRLLRKQQRHARITALDLAENMLSVARSHDPWIGKPGYVCGDLEDLPLADRSADAVFSNLALQWCNEPERVFREFGRVLRPGGVILFSTFGPDTLRELRECWARVDGNLHVNRFIDMHDLGDAMLRAGLAEPVMDSEIFTLTYRDVRKVMEDLKNLGAHNSARGRQRGLTGKSRMRCLVDAYESLRSEGLLPATYEVVYGHAWAPDRAGRAAPGTVAVPVESLESKS